MLPGFTHNEYLLPSLQATDGLSKLSYSERLTSLDLDTLECRRLIYDLVLTERCYASAVLAMGLCLCLSVSVFVCHKSEFY